MHIIFATRGAPKEVQVWKEFMNCQMFTFYQTPLMKDKKGEFIKDGVDEEGAQKYKHLQYLTDYPDHETGKILHKKGEDVRIKNKVQGVLRPIQLFEYIVPDEAYPEVMNMMKLNDAVNKPMRKEVLLPFWTIRKYMHLKPMPKVEEVETDRFIPTNAVATYPIGVRSDKKKDFIFNDRGLITGFYQEGL